MRMFSITSSLQNSSESNLFCCMDIELTLTDCNRHRTSRTRMEKRLQEHTRIPQAILEPVAKHDLGLHKLHRDAAFLLPGYPSKPCSETVWPNEKVRSHSHRQLSRLASFRRGIIPRSDLVSSS